MFKLNLYTLAAVAAALIIYLYVAYYLRVHPSMTLLQTGVDKIDFDMLGSKLPIIITDRIVNTHDLLVSIFRYQYTFIQSQDATPAWVRNSHKFAVIKSSANQKIQLAHPASKMDTGTYDYLDVVLRKDQVIILPYGWWVLAQNADIFMLDDTLSKLISYVA